MREWGVDGSYAYWFRMVTGTGEYSKEIEGQVSPKDLEKWAKVLNRDFKQRNGHKGSVVRLANLLGMFTKDCKIRADMDGKNRSNFSQQRYAFMLGAPFEISSRCCDIMKKAPVHKIAKELGMVAITAQMASESRLRTQKWLQSGCNAFDSKNPISNPMSFWMEQDVLLYLLWKNFPMASVYGKIVAEIDGKDVDVKALPNWEKRVFEWTRMGLFDLDRPLLKTTGCARTGCFPCLFGAHLEKPHECRIQKTIDFSNPKLADWELRGGHFRKSDGMWEPKGGLGMWFVLMWVEAHSNIKYTIPNREYYIEKYMTEETKKHLEN